MSTLFISIQFWLNPSLDVESHNKEMNISFISKNQTNTKRRVDDNEKHLIQAIKHINCKARENIAGHQWQAELYTTTCF